jgi:diacylglycerol kinase (ATP)
VPEIPIPKKIENRPALALSLRVRICIIFNPTARGEKAKGFQAHLGELGAQCSLKPTTFPGAARILAAEAVREGFEIIAAAGGDGTVNEVLNGIVDAAGFASAKLAVLPLGTINVFAKEIGLPDALDKNWEIILRGNEMVIDLPSVEFVSNGKKEKRYFAQLAGAGLDSRAIELVDWDLKKKAGGLAYVSAGLQALQKKCSPIEVQIGNQIERGELVLIGNGKFYGGRLGLFPKADLRDGLLDVCIFPKVDLEAMARCGWGLLTNQMFEQGGAIHLAAETFVVACADKAPFQLDGDNVGHLPATFSIEKQKLRVVVP